MTEPYDDPAAWDPDAANAAQDAYERQYTRDGTPHDSAPCVHAFVPVTPSLGECTFCGAIRDLLP